MSDPHLPAEMLDHIVDYLQDTEDALRNCCLVSKSWIPRTRKHLFAEIEFYTTECLESWKEMFPDPSATPACYARSLTVVCPAALTDTDADAGGWITGFSRVEYLELRHQREFASGASTISLFRGFSPIKSLEVVFTDLPPPRVFNLILSFPFLEDLTVYGTYEELASAHDDGSDRLSTAVQPSSPPLFTGSLEFRVGVGMEHFTHWLLSLPGGIHFRKLTLTCFLEEHLSPVMELMEACSYTLESLDISDFFGISIPHLCPQP
jgi:hypothetical protein